MILRCIYDKLIYTSRLQRLFLYMTLNQKRPTRKDVAEFAGVSVATVSYVVNNGPRPVAERTRNIVLKAIEELGYHPHGVARNLRRGKTNTIGLLLPGLFGAGFFSSLTSLVELHSASNGYGIILSSSHESQDREFQVLQMMASQMIDGMLFCPHSDKNKEMIVKIVESGLPVVFIDRYIEEIEIDSVATDNFNAAKEITHYFINHGCQKLLCLGFSENNSACFERILGFKAAINEIDKNLAGIVLNVNYQKEGLTSRLIEDYLENKGIPDCVLCTDGITLIRTIKILRDKDLHVPDDVCVGGGFDDSPWNEILTHPVPVIQQNKDLMARIALEFLIDRIEGNNERPRKRLIPAKLITFEE